MKRLLGISPSEFWLAGCLLAWMMTVPILLRRMPLPTLLKTISGEGKALGQARQRVDVERRIGIALRISRLRLFSLPVFPKTCLRRSLALFWMLAPTGCRVQFCLGVHKGADQLRAHSWVTLDGEPIREQALLEQFRTIYIFPSNSGEDRLATCKGRLQSIEASDTNISGLVD